MKPRLVFKGPALTASGYGVHARQVLRALLVTGEYDVSVQLIKWGDTPFLSDEDKYINTIRQLAHKYDVEASQGVKYDLSVQVTIPNEFQKIARVNIGVTAGIEVDRVSPDWILKTNENVDLVIVPSYHSANTFAKVRYQTSDGNILQLKKPIVVCPEGVDTSVFNVDESEPEVTTGMEFSKFNFLCVGLGLDKGMGEDRKNISGLIKMFCERFKDDEDVGLVLKVSMIGYSLGDFETTKRRISEIKKSIGAGKFPKIHLVHGRLSDAEMAALYKHPSIKAMVSTTHGEGFGLPLLEAAACGLPILATNWSGHTDFLQIDGKKRFIPLNYEMASIPASVVWKGVMEEGSNWANVDIDDTKQKMKKLVLSYDKPKEWAGELAEHVKNNYSLEKVCHQFSETLGKFFNNFNENNPSTQKDMVGVIKRKLNIQSDAKTLLFTMPMSAGDVYISTAIVDSLKKKFPDHLIFFATNEQYASILVENPDIHNVIRFERWMGDVPFCESIFDEVYTPNLAIQLNTSNWVRGGKGRKLAEEIAAQCNVPLGNYKIKLKKPNADLPDNFVVLHPGSGKGQWEARNYIHWQEVVNNITKLTGLQVVQVGVDDDPLYDGCIDFRGKTPEYGQLAYTINAADCLVSIDSVSMHMAAGLGTMYVSLFGSSYASSTGPAKSKRLGVLLETENRYTCDKACYKYECTVDKSHPCINEITPRKVVESVLQVLNESAPKENFDPNVMKKMDDYVEHRSLIAGYTHTLNPETHGFPYIESIKSMLGFCDEVVVVDGGSTDGSVEKIKEIGDDRIKVYVREWDWEEPCMDGMQKAYGRAMCSVGPNDFLWQQDADEVVHEDDYDKIRSIVKRFPTDTNLIHLPVVELWGSHDDVRTDRHSWKWRLSRNDFRITHGVNKDARVIDEKNGKTYAKKGQSDGCEYVDIMTGDYIKHRGFYNNEIESLRRSSPEKYGDLMNDLFDSAPAVFHYSWASIPRKIRNFRDFWDKCWSNLYNDTEKEQRFFVGKDMTTVTDDDINEEAEKMKLQGGEHNKSVTFKLRKTNPALMNEWIERLKC